MANDIEKLKAELHEEKLTALGRLETINLLNKEVWRLKELLREKEEEK